MARIVGVIILLPKSNDGNVVTEGLSQSHEDLGELLRLVLLPHHVVPSYVFYPSAVFDSRLLQPCLPMPVLRTLRVRAGTHARRIGEMAHPFTTCSSHDVVARHTSSNTPEESLELDANYNQVNCSYMPFERLYFCAHPVVIF